MNITGKTISKIAAYTRDLNDEPCMNNTLHFYMEPSGELRCYEDTSGRESYPGADGIPLMSTRIRCTRADVAEILYKLGGFAVPASLLR